LVWAKVVAMGVRAKRRVMWLCMAVVLWFWAKYGKV